MTNNKVIDAIVVGAGFAGMYTLYKMLGAGFSARVFEAGDNVGVGRDHTCSHCRMARSGLRTRDSRSVNTSVLKLPESELVLYENPAQAGFFLSLQKYWIFHGAWNQG